MSAKGPRGHAPYLRSILWLDDVANPTLSGTWISDRNVTIWSRILFHTGNETCLAHLPGIVNQPAPIEPNPLCCSRMPVMHSLAALIQASPSHPVSPNAFLPFHRHAWPVFLQVWSVQSIFSYPHSTASSSCCSLLGYLNPSTAGQTHLLVLVGPPVQEGAGCLSPWSGLWGRSGQRVYAEEGQWRRGKEFSHTCCLKHLQNTSCVPENPVSICHLPLKVWLHKLSFLIVTIHEIVKNYIYRCFKNSTHIVSWFILDYLVVNLLYVAITIIKCLLIPMQRDNKKRTMRTQFVKFWILKDFWI